MRKQTLIYRATSAPLFSKVVAYEKEIGMANNEEEKTAIECSMSYALLAENGKQVANGECKATISREYLTVYPKFGDIMPFHLREISLIEAENYSITLLMSSKEKLNLFNLGHRFEDFQRVLSDRWGWVGIKLYPFSSSLLPTTTYYYFDGDRQTNRQNRFINVKYSILVLFLTKKQIDKKGNLNEL